ncbi:YeiH family putative sulfate export transporter [Lachnoanaerobaculum sp. Marseille-Q4761]|uniref:YeiH family protein n=1 Tax=Lachnoanaerobaculum sp. Marseille-Q4761 TaxID=2819511 RepID=UPI001AA160A1|nr:YeiH family protein [Lachnoanaerobaculum sp. Marseille-Q4761]MBO1872045.1 YeiH family putative sulfate export transporter [Lachnoanaerobaculum sp. Marseille-Q4761]
MNSFKKFISKNWLGLFICFIIALPSWTLGKKFSVIGGPMIAIIAGMIITLFWNDKSEAEKGIKFASKYILQTAVVFLGFGLNLNVILQTGRQSLPIILCTISTSLIIAFILHKIMRISGNISTLIGVGSSICGGSAIAATAPVIDADDDEVAQAISVIFFFNVLAALLFPIFGKMIGFDTLTGEAFGIFSGTAINDTSSVTAAASTWDSMWNLGTQTLDKAVTVKLTRTLAIIPITLVLGIIKSRTSYEEEVDFDLKKSFPVFIIYFIIASLITTVALNIGIPSNVFAPLKDFSKFCIIMAMGAIGLNSNIIKLIKSGGKPIILGGICWICITAASLIMQHILKIW